MLLTDKLELNLIQEINQEELALEFYEKGEEIPTLKPGIWQVYRGVVQLSKIAPNQKEALLSWITPNHVFGNLIDNSMIDYHAVALSDVYIRYYQLQEIQQSPHLIQGFISELSYRLIGIQKMLAIRGLRRVEERLWQLLLLLKEEMGCPVDNGTRLMARLTHQNLAKAICTTRVTVTRILGDFQARNLIEFDSDRHIIISHQPIGF